MIRLLLAFIFLCRAVSAEPGHSFPVSISTTAIGPSGSLLIKAEGASDKISITTGNFGKVSATSLKGDGTNVSNVTAVAVPWTGLTSVPAQVAAVSNGTYAPSWYALTNIPSVLQNISNSTGSVTATTLTATLVSATTTSGTFGYFKNVSGTLAGNGSAVTNVTAAAMAYSGLTAVPTQIAAVSNGTYTPSYYSLADIPTPVQNISNSTGTITASTFVATRVSTTNLSSTLIDLASGAGTGIRGADGGSFNFDSGYSTLNDNVVNIATSGGAINAGNSSTITFNGNSAGISLTSTNVTGLLRVTSGTATVTASNVYAGSVSATTGTFGSIGAGAIAMSGNLTGSPLVSASVVSGTYGYFKYVSGTFAGDGSGLTGISGGVTPTWGSITGVPTVLQNISNSTGSVTVTTVNAGLLTVSGTVNISGSMAVTGQYNSIMASTTTTLDWNNGNAQKITLANNGQTFTFSNPRDGGRYLIRLQQPGSGAAGTVTWPATVAWGAAGTPTLSVTNGKVDLVTFVYDATNTRYYGSYGLGY